ncbi:MAG: ATP-binding protein [Pseudomonadota bacterium]
MREKLASVNKENQELRKSLDDRNSLFDALPGGIVVIQQEKIIDINRAALNLIGYKAEEVLGRQFLNFVHPKNKAFLKNLHKNRAAGKWAPKHYEAALVSKGGEILGCDVRVRKTRLNGRIAYLTRLTRLDKRKKREGDLSQSKKMEALITMASGLTNRLSPAVEAIMDSLRPLKEVKDPVRQALTSGLREIEDAANRIMDTTRSLRSLSKTKQEKSEETLFDLKKVVKEAIGLSAARIREEAEKRGVKIDLKTYLRSVSEVEGDPVEIRNVIVHVIANAVEAMPKGGALYLSTEGNAGYAHIYIQDSGFGIPEDLEDRILDPFFTTKAEQGIGLGLSLSSAVIRRHHGTLEVTSKKDQGTIVTIRLPIARQEPKQKSRGAKKKIKDAQILLIEDDNMIMEILSQLLVSKGCRVVTAVSGREGLNHLRKKAFDMVIVGSGTPDMRAEALARKIRTSDNALPLALIAEHEGMGKASHARVPAVDLLITKPIDMNYVVNQISELLMFGARLR